MLTSTLSRSHSKINPNVCYLRHHGRNTQLLGWNLTVELHFVTTGLNDWGDGFAKINPVCDPTDTRALSSKNNLYKMQDSTPHCCPAILKRNKLDTQRNVLHLVLNSNDWNTKATACTCPPCCKIISSHIEVVWRDWRPLRTHLCPLEMIWNVMLIVMVKMSDKTGKFC